MPGGEECELSYPEPNFLESGGSKSNQAGPVHHGIMHKMTQLCKTTATKSHCQGRETLELVYSLHVILPSCCSHDIQSHSLCWDSDQDGDVPRACMDDACRQRGRAYPLSVAMPSCCCPLTDCLSGVYSISVKPRNAFPHRY